MANRKRRKSVASRVAKSVRAGTVGTRFPTPPRRIHLAVAFGALSTEGTILRWAVPSREAAREIVKDDRRVRPVWVINCE